MNPRCAFATLNENNADAVPAFNKQTPSEDVRAGSCVEANMIACLLPAQDQSTFQMTDNLASGRRSCHVSVSISIPRKLSIGLGPSILWTATGKPSMLHTCLRVYVIVTEALTQEYQPLILFTTFKKY